MTKNELLGKLWFINQNMIDVNRFHQEAYDLLLKYINDEDITKAFNEI
jgi:hypothetical protein